MSVTQEKAAPPQTHTPGLWEAVHDADGDYAIFAGKKIIAITDKDHDEDAANASLIAAAPSLLEALEATSKALRSAIAAALDPNLYVSIAEWQAAIDSNVVLVQSRAAIAKARGRQL